ncbi:MAG TPA: DNA mismatch repair endonuclease MutL [Clostridia bacterium]|nr:DNA mismatch repair endonuclease MutL [Clostridia bacterium]
MRINILDSSVYNLIAAGEVVERPASVVKELVENSIDAGATDIIISISGSGIDSMEVFDNGAGMSLADLKVCFLPHATSKISSAKDLDTISTLGFRGEALASICAVAKVRIETAERGGISNILELDGGKNPVYTLGGRVNGTTVRVQNLFFNTPARLKFLKSARSEAQAITDTVAKLILANPEISFKYISDGETIYQTDGGGLESAVYAVYGRKAFENLIYIEASWGGISLSGYISSPELCRPNRGRQAAIVNGRSVTNSIISSAVEKAYSGLLMKRCYPVFVLNILLPFDTVDANVHPAKTEVRFSNPNGVFAFVYKNVLRALGDNAKPKSFGDTFKEADLVFGETSETTERTTSVPSVDTPIRISTLSADNITGFADSPRSYKYSGIKTAQTFSTAEKDAEQRFNLDFKPIKKPEETLFDDVNAFKTEEGSQEASSGGMFSGRVAGQLFSTYIIVEKGDNAYIIDQHAAHERILYDELMNNIDGGLSQPMLIPYVFELSPAEAGDFSELLEPLAEIGLEIDLFGQNSFKVSSVPYALTEISIKSLVDLILSDMRQLKSLKIKDLLKDALAMKACKAAVKAGDTLNESQIEALIASFGAAEKAPERCPHGRPAVVKMTKKDFEKLFKRIV